MKTVAPSGEGFDSSAILHPILCRPDVRRARERDAKPRKICLGMQLRTLRGL